MDSTAASHSRPSLAGDLLRLAIPVALIAGAVTATLWIDRSAGLDAVAPASGETDSAGR
ncbi:MAG TPA: hypothetical protein VF038_05305 [Usitatibacter sp.]|jgi:hypothetical protein